MLATLNTIIFLMLRYLLDRSRWGRAFVAVRDAEPAARAVGIHPFMVQESTLAMSGFLAGLAGGLFAPLPGLVNPDSFPILDSIFFLLAILAGGMGTVAGPVVGTIALYLVPEWINRQTAIDIGGWHLDLKDWSFLVYGALLLAFVMFLPEGIVGGVRRLWYRVFGSRMTNRAETLAQDWPTPAEAEATALGYLSAGPAKEGVAALEARNIVKRFGDVPALDGVDVTVKPGTIHAIIGPNGSGKTSLLNVISGFYRQEQGSVTSAGTRLRPGRASSSIRHGIARTFQTPQMLAGMSALDNVALGAHSRGRVTILEALFPFPHVRSEWRRFEDKAKACIALVGLGPEVAAAPCAALPFAHRRLLEIARALAGEPRVLLLDEPASGLHPEEVRQFADLLRMLRASGLTIVLVEHNFDLVGELADLITVLDAGKLLAEGNLEHVSTNPAVVEAYLGA
jgi:ABC-type branched-subunit amino acid transport system ATPase component